MAAAPGWWKAHNDKLYAAMLTAARDCSSELYYNRIPRRGAAHRCAFWDGFDGTRSPHVGAAGSMASTCYRAGKAFAREVAR